MKDDADPLLARMGQLLNLVEQARQATPGERVRIARMIEVSGKALLAVAQDAAGRARRLRGRSRCPRERTDADMADRLRDLAALLTELRMMARDVLR
ncbi:hypothetical protein GGE65_008506 [Skermanella aerolata]|uniref:hypothetical protein n=1 Tax=Skermanella aerolata TaxID=393310 RepID=UPI003D22C6A3